MRLNITAVGKAKAKEETALFEDYQNRIAKTGPGVSLGPLWLTEVEEKRTLSNAERKDREAALLMGALPKSGPVIVLDERGKALDSRTFANLIAQYRDDGERDLSFVIGGADGLSEAMRQRADRMISFGPATWPHMLVRAMLAEQLYRAVSILARHPYHRD